MYRSEWRPASTAFKRDICVHFQRGQCLRGRWCNFRHDEASDVHYGLEPIRGVVGAAEKRGPQR